MLSARKRVVTEESIGEDGCAERDKLLFYMCVCREVIPKGQISTGFLGPMFLMTSGAT